MTILDISWPLTPGMTTYNNREDFTTFPTKEWEKSQVRESRIVCGTHVGTHVDAPRHFLESGDPIEKMELEKLCGPCVVLDLSHVSRAITRQDLEPHQLHHPRVLLKTQNSMRAPIDPFDRTFIYLDASGAAYLRDHNVVCVGIDYLGIEHSQPDHRTHTLLMEKNIAIVEGLRLKDIAQGSYTLICLPLALVGLEAAPARAILLKE